MYQSINGKTPAGPAVCELPGPSRSRGKSVFPGSIRPPIRHTEARALSNSTPDQEAPVTLRTSRELGLQAVPARPGGSAAPAPPAQSGGGEGRWPLAPAAAATGLALLLAGGWLLQRRRRLARATPVPAAPAPTGPQPLPEGPERSIDPMAEFAAGLSAPAGLQPSGPVPAAPERSTPNGLRMGVPAQKRVIRGLMWVRTVAAGAAVLAAVAIIVFWSIETTDRRAGDTGLTMPLLAGWAAWWGAGLLANLLHRAFFGRAHPKFDN